MPLYWNQEQVKFITIGFELEFDSKFNENKTEIIKLLKQEYGRDRVKEHKGYVKSNGNSWDIKKDESAGRGNTIGFEIASPKFRVDELYENLEAIRIVSSFTDDELIWPGCGFHVHLGLGNVDRDYAKKFILMIIYFQKAILTFLPESRRENAYAKENDFLDAVRDFDEYLDGYLENEDRYHLVNLERYNYSNGFVVEMRHHSGTREPEKVYLWIRALLAIFEGSKTWDIPHDRNCGYFYELHDQVNKIDTYSARWIRDRRKKFIEENGLAHGLVDDLKGIDQSIFNIKKFTLKDIVLLTIYGKDSTTREDWLRKIAELRNEKANEKTIGVYASTLKVEGLIQQNNDRKYVLTKLGKKKVREILNVSP